MFFEDEEFSDNKSDFNEDREEVSDFNLDERQVDDRGRSVRFLSRF